MLTLRTVRATDHRSVESVPGATGRRMGRPVLLALAVLLSVLIPIPRALARDPWPARLAPASNPGAKGVIHPLPDAAAVLGFRSSIRAPTPDDLADARALLGDGIDSARFEGPGSFIYRIGRPDQPADPDRKPTPHPEYFVFVSASPERVLQRTWFAFSLPSSDHPRGTALLMPGLFGTPPATLDLVTRRLRAQGWAVLRMMSQPSRFTARAVFDINTADPGPGLKNVAAEFDDRTAECAFAVEAAFAHLAQTHPDLAALPRIAVGMSGGAMTLPTVVAREPARYAAAVLIAGGCDFFTMALESNYQYLVNAFTFHWTPAEPPDDQRPALAREYLEASALDSYHTVAALKGKPILMIHGSFDMAVPAHLGDLLWERLEKPERWVKKAGHEEVFMKLPGDLDRLMQWIADHTPAPTEPRP
jgi:predicted esterase